MTEHACVGGVDGQGLAGACHGGTNQLCFFFFGNGRVALKPREIS